MIWKHCLKKNAVGGDCQLVTAINAHYYLTGKLYCKQNSDEYENLVDLCRCRYGSAIHIEKVHRKLGITVVWQGNTMYDIMKIMSSRRIPLPMEWSVWSNEFGFHSTLIVNEIMQCGIVQVTGFDKVTNDGWIFKTEMYKYENFCIERDNRTLRLFRLVGDADNKRIKRAWKSQHKKWKEIHRARFE